MASSRSSRYFAALTLLLITSHQLALAIPIYQRSFSSMVLDSPMGPENGIHNLIPRYNIPKGYLSHTNSPYWEAIYFLKYGLPPMSLYPFNKTDLRRVQWFQAVINNSVHNRRSGGGTETRAGGGEEDAEPEGVLEEQFPELRYKERKQDGMEQVFVHNDKDGTISIHPSYEDAIRNEFAVRDQEEDSKETNLRRITKKSGNTTQDEVERVVKRDMSAYLPRSPNFLDAYFSDKTKQFIPKRIPLNEEAALKLMQALLSSAHPTKPNLSANPSDPTRYFDKNMLLRNLVSRSSVLSQSQDVGQDVGGNGPSGNENGRKFQTQGW